MVHGDLELLGPMVLKSWLLLYCHGETDTESPSSTNPCQPAVKIMFQVTQIVRFLLERGLRFRNLSFLRTCFDIDSDFQCTCTDLLVPRGGTPSRLFPAIS
jgi:hypothetical protein